MSHIVFTSLFILSSKRRELGDPSHPDSSPCPFMCNKHGGGGLTWISTVMRLTTLPLVVLGLPSFPVIQHSWLISYHIRAVTFSCKYQLQATPQLPRYPVEQLANWRVGPGCLHAAGPLWQHLWEWEDCLGRTGIGEEVFLIFYSHDINTIIIPGVLGVLGRAGVRFQWCWMQRSIFQPLPSWKTIDFCKRTAGATIMVILTLGFCDELSRIKQNQCQDQKVCRNNQFLQMRLYPT